MTTDVIDRSKETASRGKPSAAKAWPKAIESTSRIETNPQWLFADVVADRARPMPDRHALISDAETVSYRMLPRGSTNTRAGRFRPGSSPVTRSVW
jgi:fatty-acyl-CoA synthase